MQRVAGLFAFVLVAAALSGATGKSAVVTPAPAKASAVLAFMPTYNGARLSWLDPATLRPLNRGSVTLPGRPWTSVLSPSGRFVALGGSGYDGVRIVDVGRMKLVSRIARSPSSTNRDFLPLAWPTPRRLLVLDYPQSTSSAPEALVAIDPVSRRVVARTPRSSTARGWTKWAPAGRELVTLSRSTEALGPARLVVFGAGGSVIRATDVAITAGLWLDGPPSSRLADPGLAVDSVGRRAFIVDPHTLARIDLGTLETSYVPLTALRSSLSRLLAWLEPAAHAKLIAGFSRHAAWLGNGFLAVSGATYDGARSTPAGLHLVDATAGTARSLESRAAAFHYSQGVLLAFGAARDPSGAQAGMGLAAFSAQGERLWTTLADEPVWIAEAAGGYAYVPTPETVFPSGTRVIDLATGAVVRTVRRDLPTFVTGDTAP